MVTHCVARLTRATKSLAEFDSFVFCSFGPMSDDQSSRRSRSPRELRWGSESTEFDPTDYGPLVVVGPWDEPDPEPEPIDPRLEEGARNYREFRAMEFEDWLSHCARRPPSPPSEPVDEDYLLSIMD